MSSHRETIDRILERHGRTFAEELGIDVARNKPSPLFRLLCFCLLASARISNEIALDAARALAKKGWTTARNMQKSTWRQRTDVLNRAGYARYDESTSRMLGETVELLMHDYRGDLRRLRDEAGGDVGELRRLLKRFKGIGDTGADMFLREVQVAWPEAYPFMDRKSKRMAERLGLSRDASRLARQVKGKPTFVRLVDGLVRSSFDA
jgi:thermostable 8-oxoguanine DNA glycosylase